MGKTMKGIDFTVRTVAMIALGIMLVVLMYMSFDTWTSTIVEEFLDNLTFPS